MSSPPNLNQLVAKYDLPSKIIQNLEELRRIDPNAAHALVLEIATAWGVRNQSDQVKSTGTRQMMDEAFERVRAVLEPDELLTKQEIAEKSGIPLNTVHSIIYRTHSDRFADSQKNPRGGRARVYRLSEQEPSDAKS